MTWLALLDSSYSGLWHQSLEAGYDSHRGSFVLELELCASRSEPYTAAEFTSQDGKQFGLHLRIDPNGACQLELSQNGLQTTVAAKSGTGFATRQLRITYSWCQEESYGLFTVENLMDGWLSQSEICNPVAIPAWAIADISAARMGRAFDPDVQFIGFSDGLEPVGLPASIAKGAMIETDAGFAPVERLKVGDLVQTRDNGFLPIRWLVQRTVPAMGGFRPIELRAPFFGLQGDLWVGPDQRLLIEGSSVEYLFGEEEMLVEARHLLDDRAARLVQNVKHVTYYQILLDHHEVLCVSGAELESLYIGDICDTPELLKSTVLAECAPEHLPRHDQLARPLIRAFEAPTLRIALNS